MKKHTDLGVQADFFARPTEASRRKLQIVSEYFDAYMKVFARDREARYADLFAGPGRYDNGEGSVPIVVCEKVAADGRLQKFVKLWFNEGDSELAAKLERNIRAVEGISKVQYQITNRVISNALASRFERASAPTFIFADPCGYKGLSGACQRL